MKYLLFFLLLFSSSLKLEACSCVGGTTFFSSLSDLVGEFEYLEVDSSTSDQFARIYRGGLIRLKVHKVYRQQNNLATALKPNDTIYYKSGNGANCAGTLPNLEPGQRILLSLDALDFKYPPGYRDSVGLAFPIFETFLCSEAILHLKAGRVLGNIDANRMVERGRVAHRYFALAQNARAKSYAHDRTSFARRYWSYWAQFWENRGSRVLQEFEKPGAAKAYLQDWDRAKFEAALAKRLKEI